MQCIVHFTCVRRRRLQNCRFVLFCSQLAKKKNQQQFFNFLNKSEACLNFKVYHGTIEFNKQFNVS